MPKMPRGHQAVRFEHFTSAALRSQKYVLRLYVAGINPRSSAAIRNVTQVCEEALKNRYELTVVDLYKQPTLAKGEQIIAAPTLIKRLPEPLRRIIGDMSNEQQLLVGLDLRRRQ